MRIACCIAAALATGASGAIVDTIDVGEGVFTSNVQIDFSNGNGYLFNIRWTQQPTTGWDLLLAIDEAEESFTLDSWSSEWGEFIVGLGYGDDWDWGDGADWPAPNWWHYWVQESAGDSWSEAAFGSTDRAAQHGSWDGWVFGSDAAPQAAPAPATLALLGLAALRRRRR